MAATTDANVKHCLGLRFRVAELGVFTLSLIFINKITTDERASPSGSVKWPENLRMRLQ